MSKNEAIRAEELHNIFLDSDISIDELLQPGYPAITLHSNSTLIYANDAFCELLKYAPDEIIGLNAWLLFPAKSIEIIVQKLKEQATDPYQVIAQKKDGTEFKVELKGINLELAGEPVRAILVKDLDS